MSVARVMADRSTCPRLATACVLVSQHQQVLATGYNGAPFGVAHCAEVGCALEDEHCVRAVHAEQNAVTSAARLGIPLAGSICYCVHYPCHRCIMVLVQAGVAEVRYSEVYRADDESPLTREFLQASGMTISPT